MSEMLYLALITCWFYVIAGEISSTEDYPRSSVLDSRGQFKLYWKFDATHITFEVNVQTTGWVGIGISPSGGMINADIFAGWVKDGNAYITDRHGRNRNGHPPRDLRQNVELLNGSECDGWTMLKFRRPLAACEHNSDIAITSNTLRVIYAFGSRDPTRRDLSWKDYHGRNRGTKSLYLLDVEQSDKNFPEGETYSSFNLLTSNLNLPAKRTYYSCKLFKIPELPVKHHVVKVEPIIQPGNENNVHHMLLYQCNAGFQNSSLLGTTAECYTSETPKEFNECVLVIQGWAIGGETFYYPSHVGFALGDDEAPKYVLLETHYDNPALLSDIFDSSGLRMTYTPQLRQYDSGTISVGHLVSAYSHVIPPNAESFLDYGDCSGECLNLGMEDKNLKAINVISVTLHSHLLGKGMTLKHIRNGTELPYISKDDSYDFNYQQTRLLQEERVIESGDSMQMVCNYKSKGVRDQVTLGGLDTTREMCLAFVQYYPRISINSCLSGPHFYSVLQYFGIQNIRFTNPFSVREDLTSVAITAPTKLANFTVAQVMNLVKWDSEKINDFGNKMKVAQRVQICSGSITFSNAVSYPSALTIDSPYEEEEQPICEHPNVRRRTRKKMNSCMMLSATEEDPDS